MFYVLHLAILNPNKVLKLIYNGAVYWFFLPSLANNSLCWKVFNGEDKI